MKTTLDLRSFIIGAVLAAVILLTLGATQNDAPQVDRFRIASTTNNVFVLDTATGQVWGKHVVPRQGTQNQEFMDPRLSLDKK